MEMTEINSGLYSKLDKEVLTNAQDIGIKEVEDKFLEAFLLNKIPSSVSKEEIIANTIKTKYVLKFPKKAKPRRSKISRGNRRVRNQKLKNSETDNRIKLSANFSSYVPLYNLWLDYMKEVLRLESCNNIQAIEDKLLKADYHGCFIIISQSKNHTLIGKKGIVLLENRNTFVIVTKEDRLLTLPKENCVFTFRVGNYMFDIWGNNFCQLPEQRVKGKFKMLKTVSLK